MQPVNIRTAARSDENSVVSTVVTAFSGDPAARWAYPDPRQYLESFPCFVRMFGGRAFDHQSAYVADNCAGAALWLPPGVHPDEEALMALIERTVSGPLREEVFAVFEQMGSYHPRSLIGTYR